MDFYFYVGAVNLIIINNYQQYNIKYYKYQKKSHVGYSPHHRLIAFVMYSNNIIRKIPLISFTCSGVANLINL